MMTEAPDPEKLVSDAVDLLSEALTLLDAAMAYQPAALTDLAINLLGGWPVEQAPDVGCLSTLVP